MPMPETAAQIAIALARSFAGNVAVRIERVDGMINAPPMPMSARAAISARATRHRGQPRTEPEDDQTEVSALPRPKRSPNAPGVNSSPAKMRM